MIYRLKLEVCQYVIQQFIQFDKMNKKSEKLRTDKFALFSTVWNRFIENWFACI